MDLALNNTQLILLTMLIWWMVRDLIFISINLKSENIQKNMLEINKEIIDVQKVQLNNSPQLPTPEQLAEMVAIIIRRRKLPTEPRPKN